MLIAFCIPALIAIIASLAVITSLNIVHALIYLIVSLLSVALMFFILGAPFAAALEVIVYAAAIMMLFVFVMMMLNIGSKELVQEKAWFSPRAWIGPSICTAILFVELLAILWGALPPTPPAKGHALWKPQICAETGRDPISPVVGDLYHHESLKTTRPLFGAPVGSAENNDDTRENPKDVSLSLFGPYSLGVLMSAFLLLAGMMGAYHISSEEKE
jgi:NADH-quinone oxidoreductase subunit J